MNSIRSVIGTRPRPIRVMQYGEGNFLRGFVDYMIDIANEQGLMDAGIVLVKPIPFGNLDAFHAQDCLYTVSLRGVEGGKAQQITRAVTSVVDAVDSYTEYEKYAALAKEDALRFVVSNTTEAGIVYDETDKLERCPPNTYPGKLTKFLFERYTFFQGAVDKGLIMLPVELIDDNGVELKKCVLRQAKNWGLEQAFIDWLHGACVFTSTLVDRIITGYPRDEEQALWAQYGYEDRLIVTGEPFALWVIESERDISGELPLDKAGLPVIFTGNQKPYKQRKVRILNGAHTSFVLASYLCGHDDVLSSMKDPLVGKFMQDTIFEEVIPTLDLPKEDLISFAGAVADRFGNPFVKHLLLSISLNSVAKWRARCMPSLLGYLQQEGKLPRHLAFSLASLMAFYHGTEIREGALIGQRNGQPYRIVDDAPVLAFFSRSSGERAERLTREFLSNEAFFGQDLTKQPGLESAVVGYLRDIRALGMKGALEKHFPAQ